MRIKKTIGGEEFIFDKATLRLNDMDLELKLMVKEIADVSNKRIEEVNSVDPDIQEIDDSWEAEKVRAVALENKEKSDAATKQINKIMSDYEAYAYAKKKEIADHRKLMLKYIVERNNYEWDEGFWLDNLDVNEINEIVVDLFKPQDKKKEAVQ